MTCAFIMTARSLLVHSGVWRLRSLVEASIHNERLDSESKQDPRKLGLDYHSHCEENHLYRNCIRADKHADMSTAIVQKEIHPMQSRVS